MSDDTKPKPWEVPISYNEEVPPPPRKKKIEDNEPPPIGNPSEPQLVDSDDKHDYWDRYWEAKLSSPRPQYEAPNRDPSVEDAPPLQGNRDREYGVDDEDDNG